MARPSRAPEQTSRHDLSRRTRAPPPALADRHAAGACAGARARRGAASGTTRRARPRRASTTGRRSRRRPGRVFSCGSQTVGGFPFRIEVRCADAAVELKDTQPPLAIKLKEILVVAQVWDPKLLIAEFTGPLTVVRSRPAAYVTATWTLAQASVRGTPAAPERASIAVDDLKLDGRGAGQSAAVRCQARRIPRARAVRLLAAQSGGRSRGEAQRRDRAGARRPTRAIRSMPTFWRCCTA